MASTHNRYPFLNGGGEMGELTRNYDWANNMVGTPDQWPHTLRTIVGVILNAKFPMFLWWGPELIQFYNDAYRPSMGREGKHPGALGDKGENTWGEIWPVIKPLIDGVMNGGESVWRENQLIPIYRNGRLEDVYWTFSYSAVPDEEGRVAGVLVTCTETTEAVIGLKKLEEKEARFRALIEEAPVATCLFTGREMKVEIANELMLSYWGKGRAVFGLPLAEGVPELKGQSFLRILDEVFTSGKTYEAKAAPAHLVVDGVLNTYYFDFTYKPLFNAAGEVYGIMDMAVDVTEQALTRQRIEEMQRQVMATFEESPVAIAIISADNLTFRMANPFYGEMVGRKPEELVGVPLLTVLPELAGQGFDRLLNQVIDTGVSFMAKEVAVDLLRSGRRETIYVDFTYQPRRENDGTVSGVLVVATDVTQQVLARKGLEEAEVALRSVIELAGLASWTYHIKEGTFSYSPRFMEWLGFTEETQGLDAAYNPLPAEYRESVIAAIAAAIAPGSSGIYENEHPIVNRLTGKTRIIHALARVSYDDAGKPLVLSGSAHDITMQRHQQTALEAEVQERTEQLAAAIEELKATNEELEESNRQLVHSNNELAQYAYVASHDLQEPLRKIRLFSDILSTKESITSENKPIIEKISRSAERMSLLIQDLLEFSRLLQSETLIRKVQLVDIINEVVNDFELTIAEKEAVIEVALLPAIEAISLQMNQLFFNLISNSLKFCSPDKAPHISITAALLSQEEVREHLDKPLPFSNYYRITFADNGIGFEEKFAEHIFEVFKRLHGRDIYPGSGIGLALCRRIVNNHHGVMYAESEINRGTTFHIILPDKQ